MMHMKKWIVAGERADLLVAVSFALLIFAGSAPGTAAPAREQPFRLLGSSTAADLGDMLAAGFAKRDSSKPVHCGPCDSRYAMTCLANRECDVVLVVRSLAGGASVRKHFEEVALARYAIAVVVNAKGPVRSMTRSELAGVFEGKITSWSGVEQSRAGQRIELFSPLVLKTESYVFRRRVMLDAPFAQELRDSTAEPARQKRFPDEVVGAVIANAGGIGFFQLAPDATLDKRVRLLGISPRKGDKAVTPTAETVADGSYPLTDALTLYVRPDAPAEAREFCEFATGPKGAKIVKQFGLWPEYDLERVRGQQRLADMKAGKGTAIAVCDMAGCGDVLKDLSLEFVKAKAAVQLKFQKAGTRDEAVEILNSGRVELLLMDEPITEGEKAKVQGEEKKTAPRSIALGRMAAGIVVHPDNPLESLPLDEAKAVFSGRIRNWPAANGAGAPIRVVGLGRSDPITRLVKEALAPDAAEGPWKYTAHADTAKVILAVARDPAAIGFVDMSQLPPNEKSVRAVRITATERRTKAAEGTAGGPRASGPHELQGRASQPSDRRASESETREIAQLMPPRADALPEDYPLARTLTLYVSPKASQVAKDFAEFLTPEHCKEIIARYNLLPPLRAEATKLAGRPHPNPLPKAEGTRLALADEPIPLVLDEPDAPEDQPEAKAKKPVAKAKPEAATSEQPEPAEPASDAEPVAASEPASKPAQKQPEASSLSDKEIVWIVCGVGGAVILAIGIGWLQAPNRKKPRRGP